MAKISALLLLELALCGAAAFLASPRAPPRSLIPPAAPYASFVASAAAGATVASETVIAPRRRRRRGGVPAMQLRKALNPKTFDPTSLKVAVLGGGSFGTAMACALGRKGVQVQLIVRKPAVVEEINANRTNPYYQKGLLLPDTVSATLDPTEAFDGCDFIFHAVPVQFSRATLEKVGPLMPAGVPVISLSKGFETSTLCLMSDVLTECLGADRPLAYLSGPSFAAEIVNGIVTAVTIASYDRNLAIDVCTLLSSTNFRALYTPDVIGVEVGGAIKNVIAIAAGLCEGLGLGTNAMAALVTRGCSEMRRVVVMMGGEPSTVFGLSGVGDTFGTCFGPLSRNRQVGIRLGQGENIDDILAGTTEVAEGVATSRALKRLLDKKVRDRPGRLDATWPGHTHSSFTPPFTHLPTHPLRSVISGEGLPEGPEVPDHLRRRRDPRRRARAARRAQRADGRLPAPPRGLLADEGGLLPGRVAAYGRAKFTLLYYN